MEETRLKQTFYEVWISFVATIKAAYKLAPLLIIMMCAVIFAVTYFSLTSAKLMMGVVLLVVLGVTVIVYATSDNFGEAALALVAGLLTAYSVTWSPNRFVAFIVVWAAFAFLAVLISSIKLASQSESLYRQAAIAISKNNYQASQKEKELRKIGNDNTVSGLGPLERAETLLIFSYRKLPMDILPAALKAVSILSVITQLQPKIIAAFVSDVYKVFDFAFPEQQEKLVDILYENIKASPVSPIDFIDAFKHSRRLILNKSLEPTTYLELLNRALEAGTPPDEVIEYIEGEVELT
jgi:hypothetical protein